MKTRRAMCFLIIILSGLLVGACATHPKRNPLPEEYRDISQVPYIPDARFWGDTLPPGVKEKLENEKFQILLKAPDAKYKSIDYLALSGGGDNGAFGAGLLVGWSEAGNRPEFRTFAGISTGALTAPFAFLGAEYDGVLKKLYITTSTDQIMKRRSLFSILKADSVSETEPLRQILADVIDGGVLEKIAIEHNKGRRLYIGTTNLDAGRPVIWDLGAIAGSGASNALELVHDILLASAAIPGVFPPVYVTVEANGQSYDEIHVDGGTAS